MAPNILVVDGDPDTVQTVSMFLENQLPGSRSFAANTLPEARKVLARQDVSLVICDAYVSGENGADFLAAIRRVKTGVRTVLITAHGDVELQAAVSGVADRVFGKPFDHEKLVDACKELVAEPQDQFTLPTTTRKPIGKIQADR